ncbi:hypothetical protein QFZ43_000868 [Streptomyces afghaniensis]|nr:hypothetical protein [Streptomyces afghaniensis]
MRRGQGLVPLPSGVSGSQPRPSQALQSPLPLQLEHVNSPRDPEPPQVVHLPLPLHRWHMMVVPFVVGVSSFETSRRNQYVRAFSQPRALFSEVVK